MLFIINLVPFSPKEYGFKQAGIITVTSFSPLDAHISPKQDTYKSLSNIESSKAFSQFTERTSAHMALPQ